MKRLTKIIVLGVVLIMGFGMLGGCGDEFATDRVSVSIKTEYKENFLSEEFSIDDFAWGNIERLEYGVWHSNNNPEIGFLTIYLKKHGKRQVNDAIKHFLTLDFVSSANKTGYLTIY